MDSCDDNKGLNHIAYTPENLPMRLDFDGSRSLRYLYDAPGVKRARLVSEGSDSRGTWYCGAWIYETTPDTPTFALMPEGRIMRTGAGWHWEYHLRDHLGNTRLTIADTAGRGVAVVLHSTHYYPFGMSIATLSHTTAGHANLWLYNGKEHQPDFDLGWYDYGARYYDAEVGRWWAVDPLAELHYDYTPYAYVYNNPMILIDPLGMDSTYYSEKGKLLNSISGDGRQTNVKFVTKGSVNTELPSDAALTESLDVLNRTKQKTTSDTKGGLHGESSIVMKDGTVIRGPSGAKAYINSKNELVADETLPNLPSGKTANDVEATIHSHVTGTIVQNNYLYSHDATVPSNTDLVTFSNYGTNIIVGPLGQATATTENGVISVRQPSSGIAIYKGAASIPQLVLKESAVKRILK